MRLTDDEIELIAARAMRWLFSMNKVQQAIVDCISCSTPLGELLNSQITSRLEHEQVTESTVDNLIEGAFETLSVDADQISGLAGAVDDRVRRYLGTATIKVEVD